jgi:hypothetical protein
MDIAQNCDSYISIPSSQSYKSSLKFCPSVGLRVPARCIRDVSVFNVFRHVETVPLLDVHQLLILFAGTLTYLTSATLASIVFFNIY